MGKILRHADLAKCAANLTAALATNRTEQLDHLEQLFVNEGMTNTMPFVRKLLRQGEDSWALGIYISEQDKIINRNTSPVHLWFLEKCGVSKNS